HYYFAGGLGVRVAAGIAVAGAIWFAILYLIDGSRPSWVVKAPLVLLRLIALSALLLMLLQPMMRLVRTDRLRSNVVVLVDDSRSMAQRDPRMPADRAARVARATGADPLKVTRAETAEQIANDPRVNLLGGLLKRYNVRLYRF